MRGVMDAVSEEGAVTDIEGAWIGSSDRVLRDRIHGFVQCFGKGEW
jgi:hypothetical protein